ncbi:MAG: formyltransferase family protein [Pseudomonadota bacterium]
MSMRDIVIITDWSHWVGQTLTRQLALAIQAHPDLHLSSIVQAEPQHFWRQRLGHTMKWMVGELVYFCLADASLRVQTPAPTSLTHLARHLPGVRVRTGLNPMHTKNKPVLLSVFWKQRLAPEYLQRFSLCINYHNGAVPDYRGLRATAWSLYHGAATSGFTWHHMDQGLDTGPVLASGAVPVQPQSTLTEVERAKTKAAVAVVPELLTLLVQAAPGSPQTQRDKYNKLSDLSKLVDIDNPKTIDGVEVRRRLRAFGRLRLGNVWISSLRSGPHSTSKSRWALQLADGYWLPGRCDVLRATWSKWRTNLRIRR